MPEHLFIAGAQRSGTTWLYRMLDQHPDITMAKPLRPEPKYFLRDDTPDDAEAYRSVCFDGSTTQWLGEKSTSYIEVPQAAQRIARTFPKARILFLLRDPVQRALSNYRFSVENGIETLPLEQALDRETERVAKGQHEGISVSPFAYATRSRYADQLDTWFQHFPAAQIRLMISEETMGSEKALRELLDWLGVDRGVPLDGVGQRHNSSGVNSHIMASNNVVDRLRAAFEAANQRLHQDYGVNVDQWS